MKITCLTCTGDRPVCLNLLSRWMKNQTRKPDQWLIIDDGKQPYIPTMECDYVYRVPQINDPEQTLNLNMDYALNHIKGDIVLFCEDDEYYSPLYIETMVKKLSTHDAVGICKSKYYHLPTRTYHIHLNNDHASLAQTGVKRAFLEQFRENLKGDPFIDIRLWKEIAGNDFLQKRRQPFLPKGMSINNGRGILFDDGLTDCLYVGMKGMPGRKGIGSGHRGVGRLDTHFKILKQWIKKEEDFRAYATLKIDTIVRPIKKREIFYG